MKETMMNEMNRDKGANHVIGERERFFNKTSTNIRLQGRLQAAAGRRALALAAAHVGPGSTHGHGRLVGLMRKQGIARRRIESAEKTRQGNQATGVGLGRGSVALAAFFRSCTEVGKCENAGCISQQQQNMAKPTKKTVEKRNDHTWLFLMKPAFTTSARAARLASGAASVDSILESQS